MSALKAGVIFVGLVWPLEVNAIIDMDLDFYAYFLGLFVHEKQIINYIYYYKAMVSSYYAMDLITVYFILDSVIAVCNVFIQPSCSHCY